MIFWCSTRFIRTKVTRLAWKTVYSGNESCSGSENTVGENLTGQDLEESICYKFPHGSGFGFSVFHEFSKRSILRLFLFKNFSDRCGFWFYFILKFRNRSGFVFYFKSRNKADSNFTLFYNFRIGADFDRLFFQNHQVRANSFKFLKIAGLSWFWILHF